MTPSELFRAEEVVVSVPALSAQPKSLRPLQPDIARCCASSTRHFTNFASIVPRTAIKALDWTLRCALGIHEFSREAGCVLRYSRSHSKAMITLPSGETVQPGDPILELHFWNDRFGTDGYPRPSVSFLRFSLRRSLALLAEELQSDERFADFKAVHATLARLPNRLCRIRHPFGCALVIQPRSDGRRIHDFFENLLIHSLRWAFNPSRAPQRALHLSRIELWISVSDLTATFGEAIHPSTYPATFDELCTSERYALGESEPLKVAGD